MKRHSFAIFLIKEEIKKIDKELQQKYGRRDVGIARCLNNDIMELEESLKLLEKHKEK